MCGIVENKNKIMWRQLSHQLKFRILITWKIVSFSPLDPMKSTVKKCVIFVKLYTRVNITFKTIFFSKKKKINSFRYNCNLSYILFKKTKQ